MKTFSPMAVSITSSPKFRASAGDAEKDPLTSSLQDQLFDFIKKVALHLYADDGVYYEAQADLEDFVEVLVVDRILDALNLLGVTGDGVRAEICRITIKGGILFDGNGFMEGQPIEPTPEEREARSAA